MGIGIYRASWRFKMAASESGAWATDYSNHVRIAIN